MGLRSKPHIWFLFQYTGRTAFYVSLIQLLFSLPAVVQLSSVVNTYLGEVIGLKESVAKMFFSLDPFVKLVYFFLKELLQLVLFSSIPLI